VDERATAEAMRVTPPAGVKFVKSVTQFQVAVAGVDLRNASDSRTLLQESYLLSKLVKRLSIHRAG
jgi:hypothetical protein